MQQSPIMQPTKLTKESRVYYSLSYPSLRDIVNQIELGDKMWYK
ncbi:hypothetical protein [Candidatus Tisiphia endosymbiont of Mystacides longicornis]